MDDIEPDGQPRWRELRGASSVADALAELYRTRGDGCYDERITQVAHALQCGSLAEAAGAGDHLVAAAFLHDIGHLIGRGDGPDETDRNHELVGARFLAGWFEESVTTPIALHVAAKRYLCATEPAYAAGLSAGSVRSLELQGGPMTPAEVEGFETEVGFRDAVRLRRWDDTAKLLDVPLADIEHFQAVVERVLRSGSAPPLAGAGRPAQT